MTATGVNKEIETVTKENVSNMPLAVNSCHRIIMYKKKVSTRMKSAFIEEFIKDNKCAITFAHFYAIKATR